MIERRNPLWEGSRVPHSCQAWSTQTFLWRVMTVLTKIFYCKKYGEQIEKLSQQDKLSKYCMDAGFWMLLKSDSISWRKILQNSHNSQMQWLVVSTLCQETKKHLPQKVGSEGTPKIGPVLEVTTCCLQGKYGVEIRIMSLSEDNSHSWVRISHDLN